MKITDPDVIKNGEKDLIEAVREDLDLDAVKEILKKRMAGAALSSRGGEIVVHNNEIAYRLDFDIQLSGSLMFDRQGNYISESEESNTDEPDESDDQEDLLSENFDLEDINIDETLEEVAPQTLSVDDDPLESENNDTAGEDDLNIDLPDYDLDDEVDTDNGDTKTQTIPENEENETAADDLESVLDESETDPESEEDDLDDILQESRDFWDQKKDS